MEVTSFGQMDNIQSYGLYTIAGKRDTAMHSIHDVIQLTFFPQKEKKLIKTSYSLDELRDLESKLVLITGSKAENRAAVEQFLNVCTCTVFPGIHTVAFQTMLRYKYHPQINITLK